MRVLLFFLFVFLFLPTAIFASSSYVLPYPSAMPGSVLYKTHLLQEKMEKYWYFGDFGQFDYNLKLSDKYFVEAKTLFEYQQYLLGVISLRKSDSYFQRTLPNLLQARQHNKDITEKRTVLSQAAAKHIEILSKLQQDLPSTFLWAPEKSIATTLKLRDLVSWSIQVRKKIL